MTVAPVEQQRFAEKYALMTEIRKELISRRVHDETLRHLKSDRFMDLPGYPSDDGALETRVANIEKALHKFFTAEVEDLDDARVKQDIEDLRHRLSIADDETAASLERIEHIRRAMKNLEEHPELVKTENELAPLIRQRDKLKAKLEAGQSRNPEADFRRPFSASHFQLD